MKKLVLIINVLSALIFVSCDKNTIEEKTEPNQHQEANSNEVRVTQTFNDFIEKLNTNTATRSANDIVVTGIRKTSVSNYGGNSKTRSIESETPIYELSIQNGSESGFAVVIDAENICEVLAYSPHGSISDTTFNKSMAIFFRDIVNYEEELNKEREVKTKADYWQPGWENILFSATGPCEFVRVISKAEYDQGHYYGPILKMEAVDAFLKTRWSQGAPYNDKVPVYVTGKNERVVVGCYAVAAGQVMAYHQRPTSYNWSAILQYPEVYKYSTGADEVSRLLINVANAADTKFYPSTNIGSTSVSATARGVRAMGYNIKETYFGSSGGATPIILQEMRLKRPVLFSAQSSVGGHIWVIDAVMLMDRYMYYVAERYGGGQPTELFLERQPRQGTLLHCNWGWGGKSDGWYFSFKPPHETLGTINFNSIKYLFTEIYPI